MEIVAEKFGATLEQVCLIFAGKVLKEQETLKMHNLKDGLTVHLVIRASNRSTQETPNNAPNVNPSPPQAPRTTPPASQPESSSTPFGIGGLGGLAGLCF